MITLGMDVEGVNLSSLAKVRSLRFQVKLLTLIFLNTLLVWLILSTHGVVSFAFMILLGLMYAHGVELQHQCLHNTAYSSKWANRVVGVLLGLPMLVSFSDYQSSHMKHHRLLGTPEDKEFFNYSYDSLTALRKFIPHLFMLNHYRDVAGYIINAVLGRLVRKDAAEKVVKQIRNEYLLMVVMLIVMVVLTAIFQTIIFLKLWLIPLLVAVPTHALIELPEHFGCDGRTTDVLRNTRTIKAGKLAVWFTNGNNYHVEHHWLPSVPNDKFIDLHHVIEPGIQYFEPSYWSFYQRFFVCLFRAKVRDPWVMK